MRVLVTGVFGQVGRALLQLAPQDAQVLGLTHAQLDISDAGAVNTAVTAFCPDVLINAAAYTAVDRAEDEPDRAMAINAIGAANLASSIRQIGTGRMLHISTDYVFDGQSPQPYCPDDPPNPMSVYGRTKLQGEERVRALLGDRVLVLRTAWVYAPRGRNFLLTMLRLMRERGTVRVVADQRGTPTAADSIARALWALTSRPELHGIMHWTDGGNDTWYGFANAIAEAAREAGLLPSLPTVVPISTAQYPTRARRPANSVLDTRAAIAQLGLTPVPWRINLRATLAGMAAAGSTTDSTGT